MSKTLAIFLTLAVISASSYALFTAHKPQQVLQPSQVKGDATKFTSVVTYPDGSREISVDETDGGRQTTLSTTKSPTQVKEYYKNFFDSSTWKATNISNADGVSVTRYVSGKKTVVVSITNPTNLNDTVVVITESL